VPARDPRLDVLRGVALLVLLVNHAEELSQLQVLSLLTYAPVGVSTAAELFIFLSGLVLGLAYWRVLSAQGYVRLHTRCLARAWQLYLLHVASLIFTVGAVVMVTRAYATDLATVFPTQGLIVTVESVTRFLQLDGNPKYFDILPLYIVLLLYVPFMLPLLRRHPRMGLAASLAFYLVAQWGALAGRPETLPFARSFYYNPMAWQLLFVIGVATGFRAREGRPLPRVSGRGLLAAAGLLIVVAAWYKGVRLNAVTGWFAQVQYVPGHPVPFDLPLTDKPTLGPVRLLHFLLLATLVSQWLPGAASRVWQSHACRAFARCGGHALEVFVASIVLTYVLAAVMRVESGGPALMVILDVAGILALLAWAQLVAWRRREPWRAGDATRGRPYNPGGVLSGATLPTHLPATVAGVGRFVEADGGVGDAASRGAFMSRRAGKESKLWRS